MSVIHRTNKMLVSLPKSKTHCNTKRHGVETEKLVFFSFMLHVFKGIKSCDHPEGTQNEAEKRLPFHPI